MRRHFDGDSYSLRLFASILAAQVLILLCIKLWPVALEPKPLDIVHSSPEVIQMEEIVSTNPTRRAPAARGGGAARGRRGGPEGGGGR
ncbi:MAG: hypothetical protein F4Y61_01660, partial [Rhodothermaceae bacterium]|nr:hypothetical protein [Rhodothermaceae bacterium]